jgi:predicted transcriptional regulator
MYKVKEIAEILNVSDKSVRRYLNSYFSINDGAYEVSEKMLEILKKEHLGQPAETPDLEYERIEYFTEDEYQEFHKRLIEYPLLKETIEHVMNELDYHKKSAESHNKQMEIILNTMQQRNYIEAREKKIEG